MKNIEEKIAFADTKIRGVEKYLRPKASSCSEDSATDVVYLSTGLYDVVLAKRMESHGHRGYLQMFSQKRGDTRPVSWEFSTHRIEADGKHYDNGEGKKDLELATLASARVISPELIEIDWADEYGPIDYDVPQVFPDDLPEHTRYTVNLKDWKTKEDNYVQRMLL